MAAVGYGSLYGIDYSEGSSPPAVAFIPPETPSSSGIMGIAVTDDETLVSIVIQVTLPTAGISEVAYLGGSFGPRYAAAPNSVVAITNGFHFDLLRAGGWPERTVRFTVSAVDDDGQVTTATYTLVIAAADTTVATESTAGEPSVALRLDPITGDLVHDGRRVQFVSGADAVAQELRTRLAFFQGEWFLDEEFGIPYFQSILGQKNALAAVRQIFRAAILETPGVATLNNLALKEISARNFALSFSVTSDVGELITETVELEV